MGKALTAKIEIDVTREKGAERKTLTVRHGQDLFELRPRQGRRNGGGILRRHRMGRGSKILGRSSCAERVGIPKPFC
jgi:hypothetical protein